MKFLRVRLAFSFAALFSAAPVWSQVVIPGQDVANRAHPEYDALGVKLGGFTLHPSVNSEIHATDNYRASDNNRAGDIYVALRPEVSLTSNWSRHRLQARAFLDEQVHLLLGSENSTSYGASVNGVYDISHDTQARLDFSAGRYVESRSSLGSFRGSLDPVQYDAFHAGIGLSHNFNRLTLNGSSNLDYNNYNAAKLPGGLTISQDFRDVRNLTVSGNAQYALAGGTGLIVSAQHDESRYSFRPGSAGFLPGFDLERDSAGESVQAGVTLELSDLIIGTVQAGYLTRRYNDLRLRNVSGLTYSANILWNPSPLTSVRAVVRRSVQATASTTYAGNLRTDVDVTVHHELYRWVLLTGELSYGHFSANGVGPSGNEYDGSIAARYLLSRRVTLGATVRHSQRDAASSFLRYSANDASVSIRYGI